MDAETDELQERAAQRYDPELPYHSFDHVRDTLERAADLLERCRRHDLGVDDEVVQAALLFHDAGYHLDPEEQGHDSPEALSASIAQEELDDIGVDAAVIEQVRDCIMATRPEAQAHTPEQKIVRAADLGGLAGSYAEFLEDAGALREEHAYLHGERQPLQAWVEGVRKTLQFYLAQDIRLTPEHDDGEESRWHRSVRQNLERFLTEHGHADHDGGDG